MQGRQRTGEMACRGNGMQEMAFTAKSAPEVADDHNLHNNNQWAMRAMRAMRATRAMRTLSSVSQRTDMRERKKFLTLTPAEATESL